VVDAVRERLETFDRHPVHVPVAPRAPGRRPNRKDRLTACVVIREDVAAVSQCMAGLVDLVDSQVVVDATSTDDLAAVRNEALDQATGRWVLMLDATHTLDPASVDLVAELVGQNRFAGYAARERHQIGFDGAVSAVASRLVCLFPRHPDLRYVGRTAEQLLSRRTDLKFTIKQSSLVVHQHGAPPDDDSVAAARRRLSLLEQSVREEPDEPFHLYNLGVALDRIGLREEAEDALRRALDAAPPRALWGATAHAALARAVGAQGRKDEAVRLSRAAAKWDAEWAHGWALLGTTLVDAGRPRAAMKAYKRALDLVDETRLTANDPDDIAWQVRAGMARIHIAREEYGEAMAALRTAVTLSPGNAELRVLLARVHAALGETAPARRQLELAMATTRGGPDAFISISDFFTQRAEEALLRGLADHPESGALLERIERLRSSRALY
jgi:tetratricopeptide (TPR) repeat protein